VLRCCFSVFSGESWSAEKIAAFGSSYREIAFGAGAAEGCDLLILSF